MSQTIILTWTGRDPTSVYYRRPCAVVWCHNATPADVTAALSFAAANHRNVRIFDGAEEDMLRKAREMEAAS